MEEKQQMMWALVKEKPEKGLWLKRYAEGKTKVTAYDPGTKERTEEYIGNRELKKKVESYKHQKKMTR